MKYQLAIPSIAFLSVGLLIPASAQMGNQTPAQNSPYSQNDSAPVRGGREAMRMVPARAALERSLEADRVSQGVQFRAKLSRKVQLDNGPELPSGTLLLGRVATDDMNVSGTSKLALRFTTAVLKDGQTVPIKATIVGVYPPQSMTANGNPVAPGDQVPNSWNDGTLQVDQIGALSGVDLHSRIASRNSGVLVSSTKDNVKLAAGTEFALAIAARSPRNMGGATNP